MEAAGSAGVEVLVRTGRLGPEAPESEGLGSGGLGWSGVFLAAGPGGGEGPSGRRPALFLDFLVGATLILGKTGILVFQSELLPDSTQN